MSARTITGAIPDPATEPFISPARVAKILGCSPSHAYALIERGEIKATRAGGRIVVHTAALLAQLDLGASA